MNAPADILPTRTFSLEFLQTKINEKKEKRFSHSNNHCSKEASVLNTLN